MKKNFLEIKSKGNYNIQSILQISKTYEALRLIQRERNINFIQNLCLGKIQDHYMII